MSLCAVGEDLREESGWPLDVEDIEASAFGIVHPFGLFVDDFEVRESVEDLSRRRRDDVGPQPTHAVVVDDEITAWHRT
jgi:hypothetical protein